MAVPDGAARGGTMQDQFGSGHRYFWVDDDDRVHRLSRADFGRLMDGRASLQQLKGIRTLRYLSVFLRTLGRRPVDVWNVEASTLPLDGRGRLDQRAWQRRLADAVNIMGASLDLPNPLTNPSIIDARRTFYERAQAHRQQRYHAAHDWTPDDAIWAQVGDDLWPTKEGPPRGPRSRGAR
jgi:hypothetical protein